MPMTDPPHPGRSVRENCLEPPGLSVTEAACARRRPPYTIPDS